jgi:hypothetical protein
VYCACSLLLKILVQNKLVFSKISPSGIRVVLVFSRKAFYNVPLYGVRGDYIFCGFSLKRQNKA